MASITKRGDTYRITVSLGFDGNGKPIRKYKTFKPSAKLTEKQLQKELQKAAMQFEEQCINGDILDTNTRFRDFAERWFKEYAEKQLKARTLSHYRSIFPRILTAFGNMKMQEIKPFHLNSFYNNLSESGIRQNEHFYPLPVCSEKLRTCGLTQKQIAQQLGVTPNVIYTGIHSDKSLSRSSAEKIAAFLQMPLDKAFKSDGDKKLSNNTIRNYHTLLSSMFNTAVNWQVIPSNPCERVKPPKQVPAKERFLDEVQAAELLRALESAPFQYSVMIQVLLYTGLRRGELLGLEWSDIDFYKNLLSVNRVSYYITEKGLYTDTPKTEKSRRTIKMSDNLVQLLKEFKQYQQEQAAALGDKWEKSNRLFTNATGAPLNPDRLTSWFNAFVKKNGLPDISVHSLRHTNATLMIQQGVNVKAISSRLGHAKTTTTINIQKGHTDYTQPYLTIKNYAHFFVSSQHRNNDFKTIN